MIEPSTKVTCLGIEFNTETFTMAIPPEKLQKIRLLCESWCHKSKCTKVELQSLLGSLLYVSKCVKAAHIFLSRILQTLRENHSKTCIELDEDFKKDIKWFTTSLSIFNGVTF